MACCSTCGSRLRKQPAITQFTAYTRIDRRWCRRCAVYTTTARDRDFDAEDAYADRAAA